MVHRSAGSAAMMDLPHPLIFSAGVTLIYCLAAALLLMRGFAHDAQAERTRSILNGYRRLGAAPEASGRSALVPVLPLLHRIGALFGVRFHQFQTDPLAWWLVLLVTLAAARALTGVASFALDDDSVNLAVPPLWILLARVVFLGFERRRRRMLYSQLPEALDLLARGLRAGQSVSQALRGVARDAPPLTARAFASLADRIAIGVSMEDALAALTHDTGLIEYRFFAATLLLQNQSGGSVTEAIGSLAELIRERLTIIRRGYALTSEARTSATILALIPVVAGVAMWVLAPDYIRVLFDDHDGRHMFGAAFALLGVGLAVTMMMIQRLHR
jgi:tight adherence protein B